MGYDNSFRLKIIGESTKTVPYCPSCNSEKQGRFCPDCGTSLELKDIPKDTKEIVSELRKSNDDSHYLLNEKGGGNNSGSGGEIKDEIKTFSKKYPNIIFQLDCTWDSGFDSPPSRYYFKNGMKQDAKARMVYDEPNFE